MASELPKDGAVVLEEFPPSVQVLIHRRLKTRVLRERFLGAAQLDKTRFTTPPSPRSMMKLYVDAADREGGVVFARE